MKAQWHVLQQYTGDTSLINLLLANRGFATDSLREEFLNPPSINAYLGSLLTSAFKSSLKKAKALIEEAIADSVPIVIHGDYDADGVCATAILYNTLKYDLGYNQVFTFIPNRFEHGYGLSHKSIDAVLASLTTEYSIANPLLFVSVDSGITAVDEAHYLYSLGHKLIVTDHHQKPATLPRAETILWEDRFVGSTVAWLLAKALGAKNDTYLAYAAIATITDLYPLTGFNRSLVKRGLEILNAAPPYGIKRLFELSTKSKKEISAYDVGWVIGPRLNASGRLENASDALLLLVEQDTQVLDNVATLLNKTNASRQEKTLEMYGFADLSFDNLPNIIVTSDSAFHEGIIGLVASKLVQRYYRPALVISTENEVAKGSARSIPGIDIIALLRNFPEFFINLGGHPMAAGFSLPRDKISLLQSVLETYIEANVDKAVFSKILDIDAELSLSDLSVALVKQLELFHPYGNGNPEPTFLFRRVKIMQLSPFGTDDRHLGFRVYDSVNDVFVRCVVFNYLDSSSPENLFEGTVLDIVCKVKINDYRAQESLELTLIDYAC